MLFKNEREFSNKLIQQAKNYGFDVTRIESHGTSVGIPDMFIQGFGKDWFVELKCDSSVSIYDERVKVKWRPGQQAWALRYFNAHRTAYYNAPNDAFYGKNTVTLLACKDGIIFIPMDRMRRDNVVHRPDNVMQGIPYEYIHLFNIFRLISAACTYYDGFNTYEDAVEFMVHDCHLQEFMMDVHVDELTDLNAAAPFNSSTFSEYKMDVFCTLYSLTLNR